MGGMVFVSRPPILMQFSHQRYIEQVETLGLGRTQISRRPDFARSKRLSW